MESRSQSPDIGRFKVESVTCQFVPESQKSQKSERGPTSVPEHCVLFFDVLQKFLLNERDLDGDPIGSQICASQVRSEGGLIVNPESECSSQFVL